MATNLHQRWRQLRQSHWFSTAFAEALAEVVRALDFSGHLSDFSVQPRIPAAASTAEWREPLWLRVEFQFAEPASLHAGCNGPAARALAALIVGDQGLDRDTAQNTYKEIVHQAAASFAATASARLNLAVETGAAQPAEEPPGDDLGVGLVFSAGGEERWLMLVPSEALLETVLSGSEPVSPSEPSAREESSKKPAAGDGPKAANGGQALAPEARANLEMLLDVDLELSVSFGHTRLLLEDVLKLGTGSIVEMNRTISEPVDVLVNNYVVARGEVVVVDGNYGIRITEIVSRQERIRSIF